MSEKNALAVRSATPVKYTDGKDTWEALPGQLNGSFYLPGQPDILYSLTSLHDMIRKHCRQVRLVSGQDIESLGEPTIEDALCITGDLQPTRNTPVSSAPVKMSKAGENRTKIVNWFLNTHPSGSATKKQIADGTSLTAASVNALVTNMTELEVVGKAANFNLYRLKAKSR